MRQIRVIIPVLLLVLGSCTNNESAVLHRSVDCGRLATINVNHLGPAPVALDEGQYPQGILNSFVRISYRIDEEGRATDLGVVQAEPDMIAVEIALRIVSSMKFDVDPQISESIVSFLPAVHRTCQQPIA